MDNILFYNSVLAFIIILHGLMFISGLFHGRFSILKIYIDIDKIFFPTLLDKRIIIIADQLAFIICGISAFFIFINGVFSFLLPKIPNAGAIPMFIGLFLVWPIRIIFIIIYKNKKYEDMFRIWPFKKIRDKGIEGTQVKL